MKSIELDDDVYSHIAANTREIGESASDILRRLLSLTEGTSAESDQQHELSEVINHPKLKYQQSSVDKFLFILGKVYEQKPNEFEKILQVHGRGRKYFGQSEQEIIDSGKSTQPREIPGTGYWAMTNSPTSQKAATIRGVLQVLGYGKEACEAAYRKVSN